MQWLKSLFKGKEKGLSPYIEAHMRSINARHAGVDVNYSTAMRQADVYTCVKIISESIGMIPMKLYKKSSGSLKEVSEGTREYQIFCESPNAFMSAQDMNEYLMTLLLLRGQGFLEIKRNSLNSIMELLPLRHGAATLTLDNDGTPQARWVKRDGTVVEALAPFHKSDLFDVKAQTLDGYTGVSPITMMAEQIGTAIATQRHNAKIFENGTRLSGILSTEDSLDDEAIERLQASWKGAYGGTENAGKVAVLEHGLAYTNITMTNQDAQLLELLGFSREQIASAFRVPVHMLNDTSAQTMNNVEQNNLAFLKNTLMPYIIRLENAYNKILPSGMIIKFDTRQFVRGDIKTQAEVAEVLIKNRIISHEESREMFDLPPASDDELFVISSNNYTWGNKADSEKMKENLLKPPAPPTATGGKDEAEQGKDPKVQSGKPD